MSDFILLDNDAAIFVAAFVGATVTVLPGTLKASGPANASGKKMCVEGDESQVEVKSCAYITPQCSTPGTGTLKIGSLGTDQKTTKTKCGNKALLLKGSQFDATFDVQTPAKQPGTPPVPDAMKQYKGNGTFATTNTKFKAG
jgi:hypothetical protein